MIIEEGTVITLDDNNEYYLAHEIGKIEPTSNKTYYLAAGVVDDVKLNIADTCFIEIEKDNGGYFATKVKTDSEEYKKLTTLEVLYVGGENNPQLQDDILRALDGEEI